MRLSLQLHPADRAIFAILALAVALSVVAGGRPEVRSLLLAHLVLLAGYGLFVLAAVRWSRAGWVAYVRPLAAMWTIFTLYYTAGRLGMAAMPYRADASLARIDTWMFAGINPTFFIQRWQTPARVELFAFFYGLFIPYVNLSLVLGALGRPPLERDQFLTGWVFTYCISYVGYLFLPCQGPGGFFAGSYSVPLQGGFFFALVVTAVAHSGGLIGVFPSLHGGSSLYLCLFDLKTNRLRGLTYLPIVVMIYGATIFLRYHYVIDLVAGTIIAVSCTHWGRWAFLRWARARRDAGLPALPGGEGDVLSDIPADGRDYTAAVLPAN
ncbi:MAG: phosphatase PAP2 family protein [Tepidisphaeraceae bacterium]|jgi:hypothetical protein